MADNKTDTPRIGLLGALAGGGGVGVLASYYVEGAMLRPGRPAPTGIMLAGTVLGSAIAGIVWLAQNLGADLPQDPSQSNPAKHQEKRPHPDLSSPPTHTDRLRAHRAMMPEDPLGRA